LWRFAFKRFRRLCLFIFNRRFFFKFPMVDGFRNGHGAPHVSRCKADSIAAIRQPTSAGR